METYRDDSIITQAQWRHLPGQKETATEREDGGRDRSRTEGGGSSWRCSPRSWGSPEDPRRNGDLLTAAGESSVSAESYQSFADRISPYRCICFAFQRTIFHIYLLQQLMKKILPAKNDKNEAHLYPFSWQIKQNIWQGFIFSCHFTEILDILSD